jgi:hypothetical protein
VLSILESCELVRLTRSGVPMGINDIPLEFTHAAHKPLREHFKDAVSVWLIFLDVTLTLRRSSGSSTTRSTQVLNAMIPFTDKRSISSATSMELLLRVNSLQHNGPATSRRL